MKRHLHSSLTMLVCFTLFATMLTGCKKDAEEPEPEPTTGAEIPEPEPEVEETAAAEPVPAPVKEEAPTPAKAEPAPEPAHAAELLLTARVDGRGKPPRGSVCRRVQV